MGLFSDLFGSPKPQPTIIIKDALGKELESLPEICTISISGIETGHTQIFPNWIFQERTLRVPIFLVPNCVKRVLEEFDLDNLMLHLSKA